MAERFERHKQPWRSDEIQKLHDHYIKEVNEALEHKEQQIMEV